MINQLSENEILDYLMTSDFDEGLTPEEFKFLLKKFRNFYKLVNSRFTTQKDMIDKLGLDIECLKKQFETDTNELRSDMDRVELKYNTLLNKKLTWKERYKGIIIEK